MLFFFPHQISFISKRRGEASVWIWSVSSQQKYSTGWYTKILFLIKIFHLLSVSVAAMCICWLVMLFSTENSCEQLGGVLQITSFPCLIALCWDFLLCCLEKGLPANSDFFPFQIVNKVSIHALFGKLWMFSVTFITLSSSHSYYLITVLFNLALLLTALLPLYLFDKKSLANVWHF